MRGEQSVRARTRMHKQRLLQPRSFRTDVSARASLTEGLRATLPSAVGWNVTRPRHQSGAAAAAHRHRKHIHYL